MERMQESGLEQVFLASRPKLLRFVCARVGDAQEADDCLQDLWIKLGPLESGPIADPLAYLFRMAENLVLDRRRSAQRRSQRDDAWVTATTVIASGVDDRPSAERMLLDRERLRAVEQVLDALPHRTAASFRLFRLDGVPQKQIAGQLGISVSAVEKHLQRAYRAVLELQLALDPGTAPSLPSEAGMEGRLACR